MADKVKVPQDSGEITVTYGDGESRTWRVQDGLVSPANEAERAFLLGTIDGAKPAPTNTGKKE